MRDLLLQKYNEQVGSFDEKAAYLTLEWAEYATAWEHIDYTVGSSWGGLAGSRSGLGADSIGFETACRPFAAGYDPAMFQLFVDNVRAASETGVVHAAQRGGRAEPPPVATHDLGGKVGFVETGKRITDSDGNPSPPPLGHPGTPLLAAGRPGALRRLEHRLLPRPAPRSSRTRSSRCPPPALRRQHAEAVHARGGRHDRRRTPARCKRFAAGGGNLVLTDGALQLLPRLTDMPEDAVRMRTAYVGYSDLDRSHPVDEGPVPPGAPDVRPGRAGLSAADGARPVLAVRHGLRGVGHRELRAGVDRGPRRLGGARRRDVATADPLGGKAQGEGTQTDRTAIGTLPLGKGRIVVFGALLPQPTESYDHWFGVNAYTVSIPGQQLLLQALRWSGRSSPGAAPLRCDRRSVTFRLPAPRGERLRSRPGLRERQARTRHPRPALRAPVRLRRVPRGAFTVRIKAVTRSGRRVTVTRRYAACAKPGGSRALGSDERVKEDPRVAASVSLAGRRA